MSVHTLPGGRRVVVLDLPADTAMRVRVLFHPTRSIAYLHNEKHELLMEVHPSAITKRLRPDETEAYFHARWDDGWIDLGERFYPKTPWPRPAFAPAPVVPKTFTPPPTGHCACGAKRHQGMCARALDEEARARRSAA